MILIRSNHPYAHKRGQWGLVVSETNLLIKRDGQVITRPCFDIMWPDGDVDIWPIVDPNADYDFKEVEHPLDNQEER